MTSPAYISVLDFGAVGDGSADNTAALQAAFNYAKANNVEVYIPPGNYLHSGVLQADGIVVFGAGDSTQVTATNAGNEALILTGTNPALYDIEMAGVAASRLTNNNSAQVLVQYATGYTVENVHVVSSSSVGIFTIDSSYGNILHNTIQGTRADGIYTTVGSHNINIENNLTEATGDDAISVTSYTGDPDYTHDILISNNTVTGNWQSRSITVNGGYGIAISNNYIDGGTAGVSVGSESVWGTRDVSNVQVTGNTILNTTYTGEGTIGGGGLSLFSDVGAAGLTITGNTVYSPAHDGIFVAGTSQIQATINSNQVFADSSHPAYVNKDANATEISETNNPEISPAQYVAVAPIPGNGIDPALQLPIAYPNASSKQSQPQSPNDSVIVAGDGIPIVDSSGNDWSITSGGQVAVNGIADPTTANVLEMAYVNGDVWQENKYDLWWEKSSPTSVWGPSLGTPISPLPQDVSPDNTMVLAGSPTAIEDQGGNLWTITSDGRVATNGNVDPTTADVIELAYVNNNVWQENTSDLWWGKSTPSASWTPSAGTSVSPLPATVHIPKRSTDYTVNSSEISVSASAGTHMVFVRGSGDLLSLSGGSDTVTDSGSGNTYTLPAPGAGKITFTGNVFANGDYLDLKAALATTEWSGSRSDVGNFLSVTGDTHGASIAISKVAGGSGSTIAYIDGSSDLNLATVIARSII